VNTGGTFATSSHIGGTLFDMLNGTKMTFINYPGGAQPITDTIAGTLQVGFFTEATISQHVKSGKLKALAVVAPTRSQAFPDLPTIEEAGAKPMENSPWFGVAAPAGTPPEVIKKIGDALDRIVESKEYLTQLEALGAVPIQGSSAEKFTREVGEEIVFWNKWAKEIKVELAR
jgi:tripartite-type tricarboxylate transporter receptor subunit TctC